MGLMQMLCVLQMASSHSLGRQLLHGRKIQWCQMRGNLGKEEMLWVQALQKPAEQPDVQWKVFQGLQRALYQAKDRLRGRHKDFVFTYPMVKDSSGAFASTQLTFSRGEMGSSQRDRQLGEAAFAVVWSVFSNPPMALPLQPSAPYAAITGVLGKMERQSAEVWKRKREWVLGGSEGKGWKIVPYVEIPAIALIKISIYLCCPGP